MHGRHGELQPRYFGRVSPLGLLSLPPAISPRGRAHPSCHLFPGCSTFPWLPCRAQQAECERDHMASALPEPLTALAFLQKGLLNPRKGQNKLLCGHPLSC